MRANYFLTSILIFSAFVQHAFAQKVEVIKAPQLFQMIEACEEQACVYNFWATWCAPCIKELPEFEKLVKTNSNIKVRLISLDDVDDLSTKVKRFIDKRNLQAEILLLDETDFNEWIPKVDQRWSGAIPATLIVTNSGERHFFEKEFKEGELVETIQTLNILKTN